ncbi:hypothetical protein EDC94DRAFT_366829 [Helicostylum pulchrum]|nr:hypothetical protein EDC94DRAFT_366829 [Helicostylum pulchrum]
MGLFESRKEQKSIKLVKKLQEQADLEWEKEVQRRREQELNDEAIAKELQAQLQDERTTSSAATNTVTTTVAEPTNIPATPTLSTSNASTSSVPTSQSFSSLLPKPLYGLSSSSSQPNLPPRQQNMSPAPSFLTQKPVKSYLPSQTYKPELQFSITSPTPAPNSVFYQKTPALAPARPIVTVQPQNTTSDATTTTPAMRPTTSAPTHMAMPEPIDTVSSSYTPVSSYHNHATTPTSYNDPTLLQLQQRASTPNIPVVPAYTANNNTSYPNYQRQNSTPISLPLGANDMVSYAPPVQQNYNSGTPPPQQSYNNSAPPAQQNYNSTPPAQQSYNNSTPPAQQSYNNSTPPAQQSYNNSTPPVQQSYNNTPPAQQNYNTPPAYTTSQQNYNNTPAPVTPKNYLNSPVSVPPQTVPTTIVPLNNQTTSSSTSMPLNKQATTNPYFKKQPSKPVIFSNSVLTLKPDEEGQDEKDDEEEDEWDSMVPVTKRPPTPPAPTVSSDDESEYDYSDMIYDRRQEEEEEPLELESDPFADSFAVKAAEAKPTEPSIRILDPTTLSRQLSTKIAVEDETSDTVDERQLDTCAVRTYEEKESEEAEQHDRIRTYEEKESEEIEPVFPRFQTPIQHARPTFTTAAENTPGPVYQQQPSGFFNNDVVEQEDSNNTVLYPTNILRAGAPPKMSASNPYNKIQRDVPASDYGYYEEKNNSQGKILPKLPESTTQEEDRHITVASVNPEQRVWIRIHPTDTGKMLAERIHIVASYQTRRVTKITTKNGRNIALDNTPLFDDWDEIINFKEGEAWSVDWVPVESPYVDIITEGKEFMKLLKANFKSSSHKDT